jgi:hypothetical protein
MVNSSLDTTDLLYRSPGVGQVASVVSAVRSGAIGEAIEQCMAFGQAVYECALGDPVEPLLAAGLSWLIGVVQPLDEELGKVTGNPDRLHRDCDWWRSVATDLMDLSGVVRGLPDRELAGWVGAAADSAGRRLSEFADGLEGVAGEVQDLRRLLIASAGMIEVARGLVVEVIATFVEWAVITWVMAQAAAVASFGASVGLAIAQLDTEAALATERAAEVTARAEAALLRVERAMVELGGRVAGHLPKATTVLAEHTGAEVAARLPALALGAGGQEAAALIDSAVAGLQAYGHLPQPALLPDQLNPDRPLTRMG